MLTLALGPAEKGVMGMYMFGRAGCEVDKDWQGPQICTALGNGLTSEVFALQTHRQPLPLLASTLWTACCEGLSNAARGARVHHARALHHSRHRRRARRQGHSGSFGSGHWRRFTGTDTSTVIHFAPLGFSRRQLSNRGCSGLTPTSLDGASGRS
jgi:hypothetical protein